MEKRSNKSGLPPGTLFYLGKYKSQKSSVSVIDYNSQNLTEKKIENIEELIPYKSFETITWINLIGIHDVEMVEKIGLEYNIHTLVLEDILNTHQRPKTDVFDDYIFVVLKMLQYNDKKKKIEYEQVSLIFGSTFVITFQEKEGDVLEPLRERLRKSKGKVRTLGADYLAYAILDLIIDNYFHILEKFGDDIEVLEENITTNHQEKLLNEVYALKRENLILRKAIWPMRELVAQIERSDNNLIHKKTKPYLRDLYDHTIQVIDTLETYRELVSGLVELYMSMVSNKMNQVMKLLTVMSTIFIPLTFVAGVYGMNFENMPELAWKYSYFVALIIMFIIAVGMFIFFKKKRWI